VIWPNREISERIFELKLILGIYLYSDDLSDTYFFISASTSS